MVGSDPPVPPRPAASTASAPQPAAPNDDKFSLKAPPISLPKGGGAIRGIGEKFSANPVTGTGAMSVPIALSPGRSGFGPQLALSYDSGSGNGAFGLGWDLGLSSISRKTDKGLPQYLDADESDTFVLAGAEDLVPLADANGVPAPDQAISVAGKAYTVRRYRPRIEGLFARIERWAPEGAGLTFWRTVSADNVTTWFGRTENSRVHSPDDPTRVFRWLISETYNDKGHVSVYRYAREDERNVDTGSVDEVNRRASSRAAQVYLKSIRYGNRLPYLPDFEAAAWPEPSADADDWMFEAVFDYGDHDPSEPAPSPAKAWACRKDAFSNHRAGFEIRTYRLCRRVLMFHHFPAYTAPDGTAVPAGEGVAEHTLVRATEFTYREPQDLADPAEPGYTRLESVTHSSFQRRPGQARYERRALPAVRFEYSGLGLDQIAEAPTPVSCADLPNLPAGMQGAGWQWLDLDGEGLSGVLAEQGGAWHYAPNRGDGRFGPVRVVAPVPALADLVGGQQQWLDLDGNGRIELVDFSGPAPGYHTRDDAEGWRRHVPFASLPNIDWQDRNLRFVDLTGDGHADALITEHEVFTWYPSLETRGFASPRRQPQAQDDDDGPRLVFADGEQSIFLADMCGDGLTDLVRIRHGQVCYWPNLGHGRFGRKVTMGLPAPFDAPDQFDPRRIRLTDIDGSGPVDLIYLGRGGAQLYLNRSGNNFSRAHTVALPPATANLDAVQVADLLGKGTACLVWNSHLPADAQTPLRYIDLMGGQKPHLLVKVDNQLGAETRIEYTPSTRFYLHDLAAGRPWATKLPFPVHCVSRVTVIDHHRHTEFSSTTTYHHGHFCGLEREFRGFGRVEQVDVEHFGLGPSTTTDEALHQPPVKTVTWYHTGLADDRERILGLFEDEYFPAQYPGHFPEEGFAERVLPQPELHRGGGPEPSPQELGEAMRACKGMVLRQEVFAIDLQALQKHGLHQPVRLFSAAQHNCHIRRLQARGAQRHAVYMALEGEALTYHYELPLPTAAAPEPLAADPRVAHSLNLSFDDFGRPQQAVAAVYGRWGKHTDAGLSDDQLALIHQVQAEQHLSYTETRFTDHTDPQAQPWLAPHRLPAPCEVQTFELTGIRPQAGGYFSPSQLRKYALSSRLPDQGNQPVGTLAYHEQASRTPRPPAQKRLVEHALSLFFNDSLNGPLPLGQPGTRGLAYENYKLALTEPLLQAVLGTKFDAATRDRLSRISTGVWPGAREGFVASGYVEGTRIPGHTAPNETEWWMRSGVAGFATDAAQRFFLPERYTDAFGHTTELSHDPRTLFVQASRDPLGNRSQVLRFDHRVLAPCEVVDANDNHAEVAFDIRGLPVASAVLGKVQAASGRAETGNSVRTLDFDVLNPPDDAVAAFFRNPVLDGLQARRWLGQASARFVYHFGQPPGANGLPTAPGACGLQREQHERVHPNAPTADPSTWVPVQTAFEYSDGSGQHLVTKQRAEPAPDDASKTLRWVANGKTQLNNKGKPVRQFEPYFCSTGHRFEEPREEGVSSTLTYDAAGRLIRSDMPDGTFSRVEFSPWFSRSHDANDNVLQSRWYTELGRNKYRPGESLPTPDTGRLRPNANQRAGWLAAQHADTPAETHFDSLGREVIAIAHNRTPGEDANDPTLWRSERYITFTRLDTEGKPLWIRDALGHLVMQYINPPRPTAETGEALPADAVPCYDIAGNLLFQYSMDTGPRWTLNDAAGQPLLSWDDYRAVDDDATPVQRRIFSTDYDELHRPKANWIRFDAEPLRLVEAFDYCDTAGPIDHTGSRVTLEAAQATNLVGTAVRHWDPSGLAAVKRIDLSGQPAHLTRRLIRVSKDQDDQPSIDWSLVNRELLLEPADTETFQQITDHDALGRMRRLLNWHRSDDRVAVYRPAYNERGLLHSEWLYLRARKVVDAANEAIDFVENPDPACKVAAIGAIHYNAKGQKEALKLGNGTTTTYSYDPQTFRLTRLRTVGPAADRGLQDLRYTYDPVGNIARLRDFAQAVVFHDNAKIEPNHNYVYDALYRLVHATGRENSEAMRPPSAREGPWPAGEFPAPNTMLNYAQRYAYDAVGNFRSMTHLRNGVAAWVRQYAYAFDDPRQKASNRLWRTWSGRDPWQGSSTDSVTYFYDSHGSMLNLNRRELLQVEEGRFGLAIRWDWRDMIQRFDAIGGGMARYHYALDKQRTRKHISLGGGSAEDRAYLGGYEVHRRRSASGAELEEVESHHLFEGEQRALLVDDVVMKGRTRANRSPHHPRSIHRYQLCNHLGSVALEVDKGVRIITYEEFHPFGTCAYKAVHGAIDAPSKRYRYVGMERDEESGLRHHGVRKYADWLGRWMTADPGGIVDGPDLYAYARNSPVCSSDKSGFQTGSTGLTTGPFLASGRYGWLHSIPGYTREHVIPGSWLQYALETFYGKSAVAGVKGSLYRNAWTSLLDNRVAGPKTARDLSFAAELRIFRDAGQPIEVTSFYLRSMRNLQEGGKLPSQVLAQAHETALRELATYVKGEKFVKMASKGQPVPRQLSEQLKPASGTAAPSAEPTATPRAEVVQFKPKAESLKGTAETPTPKATATDSFAPVKRPGPVESELPGGGNMGRENQGHGLRGMLFGLLLTAIYALLPKEARDQFDAGNLTFWKNAIDTYASTFHLEPASDTNVADEFARKQLSKAGVPGPGMIEFMGRHGFNFSGMKGSQPIWTEQEPRPEPARSVRFKLR